MQRQQPDSSKHGVALGIIMATFTVMAYMSCVDNAATTRSYTSIPTRSLSVTHHAPAVLHSTMGWGSKTNKGPRTKLVAITTVDGVPTNAPLDASLTVPHAITTKGDLATNHFQHTVPMAQSTLASGHHGSGLPGPLAMKLLITFLTTAAVLPCCSRIASSLSPLIKGQAQVWDSQVNFSHGDGFPFEGKERRLVTPEELATQREVSTIVMASTYSELQPDGTPTRWMGKTPLPLSAEEFCRDDRVEELSWEEYFFEQATKIYLRVLGIGLFVAGDIAVNKLLVVLGLAFPSVVVTLMVFFGGLCALNKYSEQMTSRVIEFLTPATAFLTRWLPIMFVPSLCNLPTVAPLVSGQEVTLLAGLIVFRVCSMVAVDAWVAAKLIKDGPTVDDPPVKATAGPPPVGLPGRVLMGLLAFGVWTGLNGMLYLPQYAIQMRYLMGLSWVFLCYCSGQHLQKWVAGHNKVLSKVLQPVVTCTVGTLLALKCLCYLEEIPFFMGLKLFNTGIRTPVPRGAGDAVSWLLTPAVVSMGLGIFQKREMLFKYFKPLLALCTAQAAGSMFFMAGLLRVLGVSKILAWSVLANSVTAPLAAEATKALAMGGIMSIAMATAVSSGVIGAILGGLLLDAMNIKGNIPRGMALGMNSHGVATGVLSAEEPASAPYAAMTFALVGCFAVILASIPGFQWLLMTILA
mmetsp:Transcript_38414/g.68726  ORF Transcript_38414/g.68726 Transcript_38414/m.68726 type:complete len:689 (-) Transcript_38414:1385-3451(-)